tara:strand:- start:659 stop:2188 length:1530 start_codon:yes stop_codon:yes gene_type:complete
MGFGNPPPGSGGGGGGGSTTTKTPPITRRGGGGPNLTQTKTPIAPREFGILEFAKKYNPLNLVFGTPAFADDDIEKQLDELRKQKGLTTDGGITGAGGTQIPNLEDPKVMSNIAKTAGLPTEKKKFKFEGDLLKTKIDYPTSKSESIIRDIQEYKREGVGGDATLKLNPKEIVDYYGSEGKFKGLDVEKVKSIYDMVSLPNQTFVGADGGRVGFNVGGITDPQALAIYNSMNAYGFSDQEIADAITAQGYDAGTLGQTTTTTSDTPTTPTPSEGIIGIDLQERGGGFNPFGPLQPTFTRPAGSDPSVSEDAFFGLGRFLQGKERGTLGTRLAAQKPIVPLPSFAAAYSRSPFNPDSKNYNPDFVDQLNYLELGDGLIGMSSVGLKYGPKSVLAGKNVISGFGTNNYQKALEKFIAKARGDRKIKAQEELDNFLAAEKTRKEIAKAAEKAKYNITSDSDFGGGTPGGGGGNVKTSGGDVYGGAAYGYNEAAEKTDYYKDGGLASMFAEKR